MESVSRSRISRPIPLEAAIIPFTYANTNLQALGTVTLSISKPTSWQNMSSDCSKTRTGTAALRSLERLAEEGF
jgi:hypothetical protein